VLSKTGLVFFPAFDWAISPTHPEREERLLYTRDLLFEEGIMDFPEIEEYKPRVASYKDIARTHFCIPSILKQTSEAHLIAAGGTLVLADAFMSKEIKNGFALVRPPGHHAMKVVHGNRGFCNVNNVAVLVDYLRNFYGIKKVAIVDTDVHHGDGTQDIFYNDPDVLFISFHQDGRTLFPGTGFIEELGGPSAFAKTINIPLPPGTGDEGIMYITDHLLLPIIKDFKPDLIINSAGQDNHYSDPLANMKFSAQGYAQLTAKLNADIAVLEGGYAVESALPYINLAIIGAMAGLDYSKVKEPGYSKEKTSQDKNINDYIKKIVDKIQDIWVNREKKDMEAMFNRDGFYNRQKSIFYDTDFINEEQIESIKKCSSCSGYITIETTTGSEFDDGQSAYCISLPQNVCSRCYSEGLDLYDKGKALTNKNFVLLQNKKNDSYYCFNTATKEETEIR